jgi:hypothetical protein
MKTVVHTTTILLHEQGNPIIIQVGNRLHVVTPYIPEVLAPSNARIQKVYSSTRRELIKIRAQATITSRNTILR